MTSNNLFTVLSLAAALTVSAAIAQTPAAVPATPATTAKPTTKVAKTHKRNHGKHVKATAPAATPAPANVVPVAPKK